MTDRLHNVEVLLMLSEDARVQGDELSAEMHRMGVAHARKVADLLGMVDKARVMLERERQRFAHYLPREAEPARQMPREEERPQLPRAQPRPKIATAE
jgi:hypothetical protein